MRSPWQVQQVDVRIETRTKDDIFVQLVLIVHYYPIGRDGIGNDRQKPADVSWHIAAAAFDAVDARMSAIQVDDLLEMKTAVAAVVKSEIAPLMLGFGYGILDTLITDIRMRSSSDLWSPSLPRFEPSPNRELGVALRNSKPRTTNIHVTRHFGERVLAAFEKAMHHAKMRAGP